MNHETKSKEEPAMSRKMITPAVVLLLALAAVCGTSYQGSGEVVSDEETEELIRQLGDEERDVRISAARALGEMGPAAEDAIPALIKVLRDEDEDGDVREDAVEALGRIGPAAVPALTKALGDEETGVRVLAALTLGGIGPAAEDAIPALIKTLGDENEDVRYFTAWALGQRGLAAEDAIPALMKALEDEFVPVRALAARALGNIGLAAEDAIPALIKTLGDEGLDRSFVALALGRIGPAAKDAIPELEKLLSEEDERLRGAAKEAIESIQQAVEGTATQSEQEEPTEQECRQIDARAEEFLKEAKASRLTIYAAYVMDEPPRHDPQTAEMLAERLRRLGFRRVTVCEAPADLPFHPQPNELAMFWERAQALASHVRANPLDTDYVLMVDAFADFEGTVGPVHVAAVHVAVTDGQGRLSYLLLRNSHHPHYQEIRPKSRDDVCRLVIENMKRRMESEESQSAERVWE